MLSIWRLEFSILQPSYEKAGVRAGNGVTGATETISSFRFLERFWPDLYDVARKAEQAGERDPEMAAVRLRGFTEAMVAHLHSHLGLVDEKGSQFDRLVQLEQKDLLDRRLLAKFHTIRKLGNNAAHNRRVTPAQVATMLEDAWSLACWFCRFVRPDIAWLTPAPVGPTDAPVLTAAPKEQDPSRQPTVAGPASRILNFPADRVRRVREEVAEAMAQIDPRARTLRTRISMRDAFSFDLNGDQSGCVESISDFLADREKRVFLLKGYAGTGKTTLVKGITEFLAAQGRSFQLLAPTGRAAKVMLERAGREARTLHGSIYDYSKFQEYRDDTADALETYKILATIRPNQDQANTVYIVDEASLVSDVFSESDFYRSGTGYLLHDLISYLAFSHSEHDRKVIFVGDPAQLPPVGMSTSPALDATYLREHFGLASVEFELKEIVRQKADSGVIRNVMPLRNSLEKDSFSSLGFDFGEDVVRLRTDEVLPLYLASREQGQPVIVTFSNGEAAAFNREVRHRLFPDNPFVTPGDLLIVTANGVVSERFIANGEFLRVSDVESMVERRTVVLKQRNPETQAVEEVEIVLVFRDATVEVSTTEGDASLVSVKLLDDHLHGNEAGISPAQQRALYIDFLKRHPDLRSAKDRERVSQILRQDPYFNALRVRFGYAITCHKAQGGEWTDVFVSCPPGRNPRTADYFRWLYTAMTRSSRKLYLINPPEIRIKGIGQDWWSEPSPALPQVNDDDAGGVATNELQTVSPISPQEAFQSGILTRIRSLLAGTNIAIDDVAHYQYQEAFYVSRDVETARVNISYTGRYKVTSFVVPQSGQFPDELRQRLAPILSFSGAGAQFGDGHGTAGEPTVPFLKDFHDRLLPLFIERGIRIVSLEERQWCQRYTFAREDEAAVVDIFYDGRNRITKCMAPKLASYSSLPPRLLPEVMELLTLEFVP